MTVRGGNRKGAGRPAGGGKWGQYEGELKRVYVPPAIAVNLPEFVHGVVELLEDFEYLTSTYSESPRKKLARDMVVQLREIKNLIQSIPLESPLETGD